MLYNDAAIQDYQDLFNSAELEISIFTGKNDQNYDKEFIKTASLFLARPGSKLRIACQCGAGIDNCHILDAIISSPGRLGEVILYDARNFSGKPYFILTDTSGYRIEIPELDETIQDYGDYTEITRLQNELDLIFSLTPMRSFPPSLKNFSINKQQITGCHYN